MEPSQTMPVVLKPYTAGVEMGGKWGRSGAAAQTQHAASLRAHGAQRGRGEPAREENG